MRHEKQFFKQLIQYLDEPISKFQREVITYVTIILGKIYEFTNEDADVLTSTLSCTHALETHEKLKLTQFIIDLRALSPQDFLHLTTNINHIYKLVANNAQRLDKTDRANTIDPLAINLETLLTISNREIRASIVKKPLTPTQFMPTVYEMHAYGEKKKHVLDMINGLEVQL